MVKEQSGNASSKAEKSVNLESAKPLYRPGEQIVAGQDHMERLRAGLFALTFKGTSVSLPQQASANAAQDYAKKSEVGAMQGLRCPD
jgi:hypothetical protein